MTYPAIFNPISAIHVHDENGVLIDQRLISRSMRLVDFPETHWVPYYSESPTLESRKITVIDPWNNETTVCVAPFEILYFPNVSGNCLVEKWDEQLKNYIDGYRNILGALLRTFDLKPCNVSRLESVALEIATVSAFMSTERFVCFSYNDRRIPITRCSMKAGNVFLDLPMERIGFGSSREFRQVVWLNHQILVAQGVALGWNGDEWNHEMAILNNLNGQDGIIETYSMGRWKDFIGPIEMLVIQELYECNLWEWMFERNRPLTLEQKIHIAKQLLRGLAQISKHGIHFDIHLKNIVLKKLPDQTIKAVITDFGHFLPFSQPIHRFTLNSGVSPPECCRGVYTPKVDVWMLGIVFSTLFSNRRLIDIKWSSENFAQMGLPPVVIDLITGMMNPDHEKRLSAEEALQSLKA